MRKPFFILICLLFVLPSKATSTKQATSESDVYIIYLGGLKEHNDKENLTSSHLNMLAKVVGSKEEASKAMAYSYTHGFSGFAAKITESQADELEDLPNVVHVERDRTYSMHTTRSFDYIGLNIDNTPNNLLQKSNMGEEIIIGIIDTGIWPEALSFNDKGLGPVPAKWKGKCISGDSFIAERHCSKKIIGAYWFKEGLEMQGNVPDPDDYISARDGSKTGHGTHVASVVAGGIVTDVTYRGVGKGTTRGAAPKARLAIYKACWKFNGPSSCHGVDMLAAYQQATADGVDVLLSSFGKNYFPQDYLNFPMVSIDNAYSFGSFLALTKGITVVNSAGNSGPQASTVVSDEAWTITVGATTIDRSYPTPITLGDNRTIMGQGYQAITSGGFYDLVMPNSNCDHYTGIGTEEKIDYNGKIIMCFCKFSNFGIGLAAAYLRGEGAIGVIYARKSDDEMYIPELDNIFVVEVDYETGTLINKYIMSTKNPRIKVDLSTTLEGKAVPTKVATFSARGPPTGIDSGAAMIKPDLVAPGANIIGAYPNDLGQIGGFVAASGTSISAAHVAGIVALLKTVHPHWSPAALKSALMTTAKCEENGFPLRAGGCPLKLANPFDMGSGIVNPSQAVDPGLIYDMTMTDYKDYLCAMSEGFFVDIFVNSQNTCNPDLTKRPNLLDVNVPSISIPTLANSVSVTRTVTNVGPADSVYKPKIEHPMGTKVTVSPEELVFNAMCTKLKFTTTITVIKPGTMQFTHGSLVWTDGLHNVRIPIAVKVEAFKTTCGVVDKFLC